MRALLSLIVVAGCGRIGFDERDPAADDAVSGTRLKLLRYQFGDTKLFAGFHDSLLGENCVPQRWGDGVMYCLPNLAVGAVVYQDAQCTQEARLVGRNFCPTYPLGNYFIENNAQCSYNPRLLRRGARLPQTMHYMLQDTTCSGPFPITNGDLYEVGSVVDVPGELVAMTEVTTPIPARLHPRHFETADGLRAPSVYDDTGLGVRCYPYESDRAGGVSFCMPTGNAPYASYFDDAACTVPKVVLEATCETPTLARRSDRCFDDLFVVEPTTEQPLFVDAGGCLPAALPGRQYLRVGAAADVATFAPVDPLGDDRIVPRELTREGRTYLTSRAYDQVLASVCSMSNGDGDAVVCLPPVAPATRVYRDAACTTPELAAFTRTETCDRPLVRYAVENSCPASPVYELGPEITVPLYEDSSGTCMPDPATSFRRFEIGREVTGELAHGQLVIDR